MTSPEFALIARHFARPIAVPVAQSGVALGIGDDGALLHVANGHELVVSTDTLVSGVHFFPDVDPARLGHKALAVNLSDLAAMGATPRWFTLAIALPEINDRWLSGFAAGLFALADEANIRLVGGDTTRGPLSLTLTVMGEVPVGQALRRDAAQAGDDIWVSGTLGDAALGLLILEGRQTLAPPHRTLVVDRLERPIARVGLGLALRGVARAAIDISDGLVADLGHIAARSALGATLQLEAMPLSAALQSIAERDIRIACALSGGDDYELCFTAPPAAEANIRRLGIEQGLLLTRVGTCHAGAGLTVVDAAGQPVPVDASGFDHFAKPAHG